MLPWIEWTGALLCATLGAPDDGVSFQRDVLPILSDRCFVCHGPDSARREGKLRLDLREGLFGDRGGYSIVAPHDLDASELYARVGPGGIDDPMPPTASGLALSSAQVDVLRRWIEAGASWDEHWSFVAPTRPALPAVRREDWARNALDRFVLARLEAVELAPSPEAAPHELLRRVTLDLTGLPPTTEELDAFLADPSEAAYANVVERLLASSAHAERMAWSWLEAARYADTDGFQGDPTRSMWPWRDELVRALHDNRPLDELTIELLAGDLLPDPTPEQVLASGFNRNHATNGEGGRIPEETRVENVFDRAETTATVWLGLTLTCARCHDHKFDPLTQEEYYGFFAFFDQTSERGTNGGGHAAPTIEYLNRDERARIAALEVEAQTIEDALISSDPALEAAEVGWTVGTASALRESLWRYFRMSSVPGWRAASERRDAALSERDALRRAAPRVMVMDTLPEETRRTTHVLARGGYDQPQQAVQAGTPAFLPSLPEGHPPDRLALARWLVSAEQPLTARVLVNRTWQELFGRGLVATTEDFGRQGEQPTHPALLDWLATELVATGWDTRALERSIVLSSTYRQSSRRTAEAQERDPTNALLGRGARRRMPSWMLRDQALALSGRLSDRVGGPPVKPYQPPGVWAEATFDQIRYVRDMGDAPYRRSLYVFWRRIVGPTVFFDAGDRQSCSVRRTATDTPLHALTLMNETAYVEAARGLAERAWNAVQRRPDGHNGERDEAAVAWAFRAATARWPDPVERATLCARLYDTRARFTSGALDARALLSVGDAPSDPTIPDSELAALTAVCLVVLNLDEVLSTP